MKPFVLSVDHDLRLDDSVPDLLHPFCCKRPVLLAHFEPAALQLKNLNDIIASIEHFAARGFLNHFNLG